MKSLKPLFIALILISAHNTFADEVVKERLCVRPDGAFGDFCNNHKKWFSNIQEGKAYSVPAVVLKNSIDIKSKGESRGRYLKKSDSDCDIIVTLGVDEKKVAGNEDVRLKQGMRISYANSKVTANGYGPRGLIKIEDEKRGVTFMVSAISSCSTSDVMEFLDQNAISFEGTTSANGQDCKKKPVEISSLEQILKTGKKNDLREASFNGSLPKSETESAPDAQVEKESKSVGI